LGWNSKGVRRGNMIRDWRKIGREKRVTRNKYQNKRRHRLVRSYSGLSQGGRRELLIRR
jgi:hypothetical protein